MHPSFAESYLIELLGNQLLLEPSHLREARRGIERALKEMAGETAMQRNHWNKIAPIERLTEAIEIVGTAKDVALVNLLDLPFGTLWVRAVLMEAKKKLQGQSKARVIIVGLWQILRGKANRRTEYTEKRFNLWRDFVEAQLASANVEDLRIVWIG